MYFEGTYETVHYSVVIYDIDHVEIKVIGDKEVEEDYYDDEINEDEYEEEDDE